MKTAGDRRARFDVTRPDADPVAGNAFYKCNSIRSLYAELVSRGETVPIGDALLAVLKLQHPERLRLCAEMDIYPDTLRPPIPGE